MLKICQGLIISLDHLRANLDDINNTRIFDIMRKPRIRLSFFSDVTSTSTQLEQPISPKPMYSTLSWERSAI